MKKILSTLFIILFCSFANAEVHIAKENHIPNREPGLCSWASLETLCLTHGWKKIAGLTAGKKETDFHDNLVKEMKRLGVKLHYTYSTEKETLHFVIYEALEAKPVILWSSKSKTEAQEYIKKQTAVGSYWLQEVRCWKLDFLKQAVKDDLGAAVSIDGYAAKGKSWRHMLVLTDINECEVKLVDSNYKAGTIHSMNLIQFMQMWCGFAIVIEKP